MRGMTLTVITSIIAKKSGRLSYLRERADQRRHRARVQMPAPLALDQFEVGSRLREQTTTLRRDPRRDVPPVSRITHPAHQLHVVHPVQQTRDVGDLGDEPLGYLPAAQALLARTLKDAKNVVLRVCYPVRSERLVLLVLEQGRSPQDGQQSLGRPGWKRPGLTDLLLQGASHDT